MFFFLIALKILPNDSKALFRRCQGYEKLGKLENAFRDARTLIHLEPKVLMHKLTVFVEVQICGPAMVNFDKRHVPKTGNSTQMKY